MDTAQQHVSDAVEGTYGDWHRQFSVHAYEPCKPEDFQTPVKRSGTTTAPRGSRQYTRPHVAILPNNQLGMYGRVAGGAWTVADAWFIEGFCFGSECECDGLPVWRLCRGARVGVSYEVEYALVVSLDPDPVTGALPAPTVSVAVDVPFVFTNECAADAPNATLPFFADKFNASFMTNLHQNFTSLIPRLRDATAATVHAFAATVVRPAAAAYFPASTLAATGLRAVYRVDGAASASVADVAVGVPDDAARVTWNVSAGFSAVADTGETLHFAPNRSVFAADGALFAADVSTFDTERLATQVVLSSAFVQVSMWFAAAKAALNRLVTNTVLDATVRLHFVLTTPATRLWHGAATVIDTPASLEDRDVGPFVESLVPRSELTGAREHTVFTTVRLGRAHGTCGPNASDATSLRLLDASIRNVTTRSDVLLQADAARDAPGSSSVFAPGGEGGAAAAVTPTTVSLYVWTQDFNGFADSECGVAYPTGGIPKVTLRTAMHKGLNETLPRMNAAYRSHRVPLPPAALLLLAPAGEASPFRVPNATLTLVNVSPPAAGAGRNGTATNGSNGTADNETVADFVAVQGRVTLFTPRPSAPVPPPPPRFPDYSVRLALTVDSRRGCGAGVTAPPTTVAPLHPDGNATAVPGYAAMSRHAAAVVLGPRCGRLDGLTAADGSRE